ncbi:WRKY transcription factor 55 [Capsicum annuum]|uniref:WRKY transcription factor 55 n=1 Tax=Capsicum annuum TaxID=4072 RepID=A0A2G2Z8C9_CAPAN|nr:WRKY transcription factor 55 [Capsicum annuum]
MTNLGAAKKILGMKIMRDREKCKLYLSQKNYIEKVLHKFNMQNAKPIYLMPPVQLADIWQILAKNIGKQFRDHDKRRSLTAMFSPLVVVLLVGKLPYRLRLLCQLLRMGDTDRRTVRVAAPRMGNLELPPEDGYTWRKYGQKEILGSRFPRCTHQKLYHCPAKKQVQRLDNDPYVFEVTYRSQHICYMSATAPTVPPPSVEEITHQTTTTPPPLLPLPPPTSASLSGHWLSMDIKPQVEAGTSYSTAQFDIQRDFGHASGGSLTSICNVVTACVDGGAGPSGSRFGREVDYQPVVDMADAMFNSGSSSNTSMDIIFSSIDDKWDTTQKKE